MKSLLVVTGPPGAGKSTVARVVAGRFDQSVVVEGDLFYSFLAAGAIAPWLEESRSQNESIVRSAARCTASLVADFHTVYEGVLGPWQLDAFMAAGAIDSLDYLVLLPPVDVCLRRIAERTGHGFDDAEAARHMHAQFADATIDERHVIRAGSESVEEVADQIEMRRSSASFRFDTRSL